MERLVGIVPSRVALVQRAEVDFATILNRNTTDRNAWANTNRHGRATVGQNVQVRPTHQATVEVYMKLLVLLTGYKN